MSKIHSFIYLFNNICLYPNTEFQDSSTLLVFDEGSNVNNLQAENATIQFSLVSKEVSSFLLFLGIQFICVLLITTYIDQNIIIYKLSI